MLISRYLSPHGVLKQKEKSKLIGPLRKLHSTRWYSVLFELCVCVYTSFEVNLPGAAIIHYIHELSVDKIH